MKKPMATAPIRQGVHPPRAGVRGLGFAAMSVALWLSAPAHARRVFDEPNSSIGLELGQRFSPDLSDPFVFPVTGFFGSFRMWDEMVARLTVDVGYSQVPSSPLGAKDANLMMAGLIFDIIWAIPVGRGPELLVGGRLGYRYTCLWADHDLRPTGAIGNAIEVSDFNGYAFGALLGVMFPLREFLSLSVEARAEYSAASLIDRSLNAGGYSVHGVLWWRFFGD